LWPPIILGKKLDFAAYDIDIKFEDEALRRLAKNAFNENTGARGLVSAVERALLIFEKKLPSLDIKRFPVTASVIENPERSLAMLIEPSNRDETEKTFQTLCLAEKEFIKQYLSANKKNLSEKYGLTLTPSRIDIVAAYYSRHILDIEKVIKKIKTYYDEIKNLELYFFKNYDINIVMEEEAVDFIIEQLENSAIELGDFYKRLSVDFEHGLKLVQEKTGRTRFFITKDALLSPESFISRLMKDQFATTQNSSGKISH